MCVGLAKCLKESKIPKTDDFAAKRIGNLKFIFAINLISVKHEIEVNENFVMKFDTFLKGLRRGEKFPYQK